MAEKSIFETLNSINVSAKTEKKNGLTYLSWAWAWGEIKKVDPQAQYRIYEADNGCIYHTDGRTCWVKVSVTVHGLEHIEYLPVLDYKNASIPLDKITSYDANKAVQRAITKACARHGLGLYIYAGEDLPEEMTAVEPAARETAIKREKTVCAKCGQEIKKYGKYTAKQIIDESTAKLGQPVCMPCWLAAAEEKRKAQENNIEQ